MNGVNAEHTKMLLAIEKYKTDLRFGAVGLVGTMGLMVGVLHISAPHMPLYLSIAWKIVLAAIWAYTLVQWLRMGWLTARQEMLAELYGDITLGSLPVGSPRQ